MLKRIAILLLLFAPIAEAQIKQITGGAYQNSNGVACAGCILYLQLPVDATVIGTGQIVPNVNSYQLDANGNVPANSNLWANDQLTPSGLTYKATLTNAGGGRIWGPEFLSITGTSPISLTQLVPVASSSVFFGNPAVLNLNNTFTGNNTFSGTTTLAATTATNLTVSGTGTFTSVLNATNIVGTLYANQYATGGSGTSGSPWTSASGTGGIQEAINAAGVADGGNARIHLPSGFYSITTCINATANVSAGQGNSPPPSPLVIDGDGPGKTVIVGSTSGCMFDFTGRVGRLAELTMIQGASNLSTIGVLQGRSTNNVSSFSSGNKFEHLVITLATNSAANGGNGTIGFYCYSSEGNHYFNNSITADRPYVFTSNNLFSISSAYQTQNTTLRFVSQNKIEEGSCTSAGMSGTGAGECILVQGHADNFEVNHVAGECIGATPSPVFLRINTATAPDSATDPIGGLNLQNAQAECATGGQLIVDAAPLTQARIHGTFKNIVSVPIITLSGANAQLVNPFIDLHVANAGVSSPLISDGGVASAGFTGGVIFLPATTTISFTNAASGCNGGTTIIASYASPTITCANSNGIAAGGGTLAGSLSATDRYYLKGGTGGTIVNEYVSNSEHKFDIAGSTVLDVTGTNFLVATPGTSATSVATLSAAQTLTSKTLNVPLTSGTGLQIFNTTTTCTTGAAIGSTCTTAAISLPVAEADTAYRITCTGKGPTAVPVVSSIANSSATQFTITIAALTAVAASFASYDCIAGHN